jgi:hypothetical protein
MTMKRPISTITLVAMAAVLLLACPAPCSDVLLDGNDGEPTPVIGSFTAFLTEDGQVILRWTLDPGVDADAINVYRGTDRNGPFERINPEPLEPESPGVYIDDTIWEGTCFWYELCAWFSYESEEFEFPLSGSPAYITTGGSPPMRLLPPCPNPTPGSTHIEFDVPETDALVELTVYNARGQRVKTLFRASMEPGPHTVDWGCVSSCGSPVAGGVYFVRMVVGAELRIRKVLVVR